MLAKRHGDGAGEETFMSSIHVFERGGLVLAILALHACGGSAPAGDAGGGGNDAGGAASSLVGTWRTTGCVGSKFVECTADYTFAADGSYSIQASSVKDPTTTTGFAGCTITLDVSGYAYTATASTLSVTASSPVQLESRTGCVDPADDSPTPSPSPEFTPSSYLLTGVPYEITGGTLTLGGPGGAVLTRL
jgi:hypothetical protein